MFTHGAGLTWNIWLRDHTLRKKEMVSYWCTLFKVFEFMLLSLTKFENEGHVISLKDVCKSLFKF